MTLWAPSAQPAGWFRLGSSFGIIEPGNAALTGAELDALDATGFANAVRTVSVYARVAPAHKLRIVAALQADDVGVAMGVTGTEVTKEAARMILADDNFATIVDAVREGRALFDNIRKFLRCLLSSNMGEVLTVFLSVVGASVIGLGAGAGEELVLPLLATQILWINLIADSEPVNDSCAAEQTAQVGPIKAQSAAVVGLRRAFATPSGPACAG